MPTRWRGVQTAIPWLTADQERGFFCAGEDESLYRRLADHGAPPGSESWFDDLATVSAHRPAIVDYVAVHGHALPAKSNPDDFKRSFDRIHRHFGWISGPIRAALVAGHRIRVAADVPLELLQALQSSGLLATDDVPVVLRKCEAPIAVIAGTHDGAHILRLSASLVRRHYFEATPAPELEAFPADSVTFALFDDKWLDGFDNALRAAQDLLAQSTGLAPGAIGRGMAVVWNLELSPLWDAIDDLGDPTKQVWRVPLGGASASAAFALMTANLLASELAGVRSPISFAADHLSLTELRAMPLREILVSAEVNSNFSLGLVGGFEARDRRLPGKLSAAEPLTHRGELLAIAVASEQTDVARVGDCPVLSAGSVRELASILWDNVSARLFGKKVSLSPRVVARSGDDSVAPVDPTVKAKVRRLEAHVRHAAVLSCGSYIAVEVERAGESTQVALEWIRACRFLPGPVDDELLLVGWTFGEFAAGFPWNTIDQIMGGLEYCARHLLELRRIRTSSAEESNESRFHEFIRDCGRWSARSKRPVVLLLDGLDEILDAPGHDVDAELGRWLPWELPAGVHIVITAMPCGIFDRGAWVPSNVHAPIGLSDGDQSTIANYWVTDGREPQHLRIAGLRSDWRTDRTVHLARIDPTGRRVCLRSDQYSIVSWLQEWQSNPARVVSAIDALAPALPTLVLNWPGGQSTTDLESALATRIRGTRSAVLVCDPPPAPQRQALLGQIRDKGGGWQPVDVGVLPGLDRGAYVLLIESVDAERVLQALRGTESLVPASQPRRWWLDLDSKGPIGSGDLLGLAVDGPDREWLRRFPEHGSTGLFFRHGEQTPEEVASAISSHAASAIVIVSCFPDWLNRLAAEVERTGPSTLRMQVASDAPSTISYASDWASDPLEDLEDFLQLAAKWSPSLWAALRQCTKLLEWKRTRPSRSESHADGYWALLPGLGTAVQALASHAPSAASELVRALASHLPALAPALANACAESEHLRDELAFLLDTRHDAFGDAVAFQIADLVTGSEEIFQVVGDDLIRTPTRALRLALAHVRKGGANAQTALVDRLCGLSGPLVRGDLQAVCHPDKHLLDRSADAIQLASRAYPHGTLAVQRALGSPPTNAEPYQLTHWASIWTGQVDLRGLVDRRGLWPVIGFVAEAGNTALAVADINVARLGIPQATRNGR